VLERCGDAAAAAEIRREGESLAEINGLFRLSAQYGGARLTGPVAQAASIITPPIESATGGAILTIKEREILGLLAQNLSNKEIAIALDLSEQTVKWHLKNLFQKLDGANRKHTVARARMLGLIAA
jgi:LuxR family maltose regulon positive regulatory protein